MEWLFRKNALSLWADFNLCGEQDDEGVVDRERK